MAYKARDSAPIAKAQLRVDGLAAIDPTLDLGETASVSAGTALGGGAPCSTSSRRRKKPWARGAPRPWAA
jgi:hypothetical protein